MNVKSTIIIFFLCLRIVLYSQQSPKLSKEQIIELYKKLYLTSQIDSIVWKGNIKKCDCGTIDNSIYTKAENRINFFREVNGLNKVKINTKFNTDAQCAALLIKANNLLTHNPAKNLKCYSPSAYSGCSKSCLGFTDFKYYSATAFITGFVTDYGDENYAVGHRKWILYSRLREFGYGATNNTEALFVVDGIAKDSVAPSEFIAYPWNGYVPVNLIFPKWSFSIPDSKTVDYSNATITMTDASGKKIEIQKLKEQKNMLDHTIVWTALGLFSKEDMDFMKNKLEEKGYLNKKIKVQVKNVKVDGKIKNYEYFVEPIKI